MHEPVPLVPLIGLDDPLGPGRKTFGLFQPLGQWSKPLGLIQPLANTYLSDPDPYLPGLADDNLMLAHRCVSTIRCLATIAVKNTVGLMRPLVVAAIGLIQPLVFHDEGPMLPTQHWTKKDLATLRR